MIYLKVSSEKELSLRMINWDMWSTNLKDNVIGTCVITCDILWWCVIYYSLIQLVTYSLEMLIHQHCKLIYTKLCPRSLHSTRILVHLLSSSSSSSSNASSSSSSSPVDLTHGLRIHLVVWSSTVVESWGLYLTLDTLDSRKDMRSYEIARFASEVYCDERVADRQEFCCDDRVETRQIRALLGD